MDNLEIEEALNIVRNCINERCTISEAEIILILRILCEIIFTIRRETETDEERNGKNIKRRI